MLVRDSFLWRDLTKSSRSSYTICFVNLFFLKSMTLT